MQLEYVIHNCYYCGHPELKKIYQGRHSRDQAQDWICQCDQCKSITTLYIMDYDYKRQQHNVVVER
jgi:hypothetical protein